jgi:hypothetical protein
MYHPFSILETIKSSWHIFKRNFVTIIVYSGITFILLSVLTVAITLTFSPDDFLSSMIMSLLLIFIQAYSTLGLYKLIFTVIDSEYYEFEFAQIIPTVKMVLSYLAVIFMFAFIATNYNIGMNMIGKYDELTRDIVNIISTLLGIYLLFRIMFFNTFIVDDHSGPIESIKQSFVLTKGHIIQIIMILGIILLLIAVPIILSNFYPFISLTILFTYPFVNIILAVTYRRLVYSHMDIDDDVAETD